jgi:hypothetical protein
MNDEEAIDWREGFQDFHWTRRTSSRRGDGRWARRPHIYQGGFYVFFLEEKEEDEFVKEDLVLMCEKGWFMEKMCANKEHERKLCVASSSNGVHGRMSMTKPLDSYLK